MVYIGTMPTRRAFLDRLTAVTLIGLPAACWQAPDPDVRIAAATNLRPALEAIAPAFAEGHGARLSITYGSTGKLTAQIVQGAPFDLFLAADQARPAFLDAEGQSLAGSRAHFATGRLMLWTPGQRGDTAPRAPLGEQLTAPTLQPRSIAIANPDLAPYGRAAVETLGALGLAESLSPRLVRGENIGQAFALVASGNAGAGFIAASQAGAEPNAVPNPATLTPVPDTLHSPIRQDMVLTRRATGNTAASALHAFILSPAGQAILSAHGYRPPAETGEAT